MSGTPITRPASYSTRCRTALILSGTGSAGAYHAGVLQAFAEAGVRLDLVAGQGIGAVAALFHAVDGGARLWADGGLWHQKAVAGFYRWRPAVRVLAGAAAAALAVVVGPAVLLAIGTLVYLAAFFLGLVGVPAGGQLADRFTALVHEGFQPGRLTTWIPQAALVGLTVVFVLLLVASSRSRLHGRYREEGAFWWRVFGAPLSAEPIVAYWRKSLWRQLVGGTKAKEPDPVELSHRYAEVLGDNLGQPGFREVIALVHDSDTRRDLVGAALAEPFRTDYFSRPLPGVDAATAPRASETLDLIGADRDRMTDMLAAAVCLPVVTPGWPVTFAPESYWRGETHRLCDRPGAVARLLDEALAAGAEQVIVVSSVSSVGVPHALSAPRIDGFGRVGEWLASQEAVAVRDAIAVRRRLFRTLHLVAPSHNPTGPLDFTGAYDGRSDRVQQLPELIARGYEDAYRQFIEPVVGATDEPTPAATPVR